MIIPLNFLNLIISFMKRKFKQWRSTIPPNEHSPLTSTHWT